MPVCRICYCSDYRCKRGDTFIRRFSFINEVLGHPRSVSVGRLYSTKLILLYGGFDSPYVVEVKRKEPELEPLTH